MSSANPHTTSSTLPQKSWDEKAIARVQHDQRDHDGFSTPQAGSDNVVLMSLDTTTPLRSSPSPSFPTPLSGSCSGQKQSTMPIAMYASGASHSSDSELVPIAVPTVKKTGAPGLLRGGGVEQFKFTGSNDNMKTKTSPATNLPLTTKRGADDANTAHSNKENMGPAPKRIRREKTGTEWQTVLDLAEYGQESSGDGKGLDIRSNRTRTEHPPVPLT